MACAGRRGDLNLPLDELHLKGSGAGENQRPLGWPRAAATAAGCGIKHKYDWGLRRVHPEYRARLRPERRR